ncbi:MAG: hypothetical protein RL033_6077 [Pseudomonadota bacterium]
MVALIDPHSAAFAQVQPDAAAAGTSTESVDALIDQGIALRKSGADARALVLFQQAEQLEPDSARVQVHLAATHQALGEWEAADRYLSKALEQQDPYILKHQTTLAAARRAIDAHMGTLEIVGKPAGAEVRLNGRLIGTLPLQQAVRLEAGIYALEVTLPGHYPVTRSVALAGGHLARDTVTLLPQSSAANLARAELASPPAKTERVAPTEQGRPATWVTWTLAGGSLVAAAASAAFWATREQQAEHWNDNTRCQGGGQTRGSLCGEVLDRGERAETWMYVTGGASAVFAAGALLNYLLQAPGEAPATADALACGVGLGSLSCAGQF